MMSKPGRARITDLIDADASSPHYCGHSIGRVIAIGDDYLHVLRVERSGEYVWGVGEFISPTQAAKLQTRWDIRWGFRCAPQPAPDTPEYRAGGPIRKSGSAAKFNDVDSAAAEIVKAGYRELSKRYHPDAGGDHHSMSLLTQAKSQLVKILDLAKGRAA